MRPEEGTIDGDDPSKRFEDFYRANVPKLTRHMMLVGANSEEAEEAVGEAMLDLWWRWPQVEDKAIEHPYSYVRIAAVRSFHKARGRDSERHLRSLLAHELSESCTNVDMAVTRYDGYEWVRQLLGLLPADQQRIMALTLDGLKAPEIAALLGRTPAAVRKNLQRARRQLADVVHEERDQDRRPPLGGRHTDE